LLASTKYWLMLDATAGEYTWRGNSPGGITPTSQVGASFGTAIGLVGDQPRSTLGPPSFEILSVPEPTAQLVSGLWMLSMCLVRVLNGYPRRA
jgi:hypothetical protein